MARSCHQDTKCHSPEMETDESKFEVLHKSSGRFSGLFFYNLFVRVRACRSSIQDSGCNVALQERVNELGGSLRLQLSLWRLVAASFP
jgi:hypothetical protein